jgi:hypothetical protein
MIMVSCWLRRPGDFPAQLASVARQRDAADRMEIFGRASLLAAATLPPVASDRRSGQLPI